MMEMRVERELACVQCGGGAADGERCDVCLVLLCLDCVNAATWCDGCGLIACRACEPRSFLNEPSGNERHCDACIGADAGAQVSSGG